MPTRLRIRWFYLVLRQHRLRGVRWWIILHEINRGAELFSTQCLIVVEALTDTSLGHDLKWLPSRAQKAGTDRSRSIERRRGHHVDSMEEMIARICSGSALIADVPRSTVCTVHHRSCMGRQCSPYRSSVLRAQILTCGTRKYWCVVMLRAEGKGTIVRWAVTSGVSVVHVQ
jgi:hypothetical protein